MTRGLKCVMVCIGPRSSLISEPLTPEKADEKLQSIKECLSKGVPFYLRGTVVAPSKVVYAHIVDYRPEEVRE